MRILHVCLRYPPATGGVETYVREIVERTRHVPAAHEAIEATEAREATRDVRVLTSKLRTHGPASELDPNLLLDDPIYVQRLHHMRTPCISYPRLQALKYYIGHHTPDILHGYSFWYQPADVTARYARRHDIPFIFHPMYYENATRRRPTWRLYRSTVGRQTFAAADVVVVISPQEQTLIEKAGFPVKRCELIPPGIDTHKYEIQHPNPFGARGIRGTILLSVGRIAAGKGLADMVEILPHVLKEFPDTHWVLAGEDFGFRSGLERQAQQLGLSNHLHILGKLSDEELAAAYQHATILVHPSHDEAFGIVLAEAQAAGTPVVARRVGAIPFVVAHKQTGLLFDGKQQLFEALTNLLRNPSTRHQYGQDAARHIQQRFSWNTSVQKILKLYDELNH